jgi:hypothetical protein
MYNTITTKKKKCELQSQEIQFYPIIVVKTFCKKTNTNPFDFEVKIMCNMATFSQERIWISGPINMNF